MANESPQTQALPLSDTDREDDPTPQSIPQIKTDLSLSPNQEYIEILDDVNELVMWRLYPAQRLERREAHRDKKGNPTTEHIGLSIQWETLTLTELVRNPKGISLYSGSINNIPFTEITIKELTEIVAQYSQNKNALPKFQVLFQWYWTHQAKAQKLPFYIQCIKFGFEDRWYLPDEYRIAVHPGIQSRCRDAIKNILSNPIFTDRIALEAFKAQYVATTMPYKDLIFAFAMMQAFFYPLFPKTDLIPFLYLDGIGEVGISQMAKNCTVRWFDHLGKDDSGREIDVLNSRMSIANIKEYMASIGLGITFDDIHLDWGDDIKGLIKSYLTNNTQWQLKNQKSEIATSIMYKATPFFTGNGVANLFMDVQMQTRGLILHIGEKSSNKDAERYKRVMACIPRGLIGWYIIKKSREWTVAELNRRYDAIPNFYTDNEPGKVRANTIIKLLTMGKQLIKEWFDIDVDICKLPVLLTETKKTGNDVLFEGILHQIQGGNCENEANIRKIYGPKSMDGHAEVEKIRFEPQESWIKTVVYPHERKKETALIPGFLYTLSNLKDFQAHFKEGTSFTSLRDLAIKLKASYFPNLEYLECSTKKTNPFTHEKEQFRNSIFIPTEDLNLSRTDAVEIKEPR